MKVLEIFAIVVLSSTAMPAQQPRSAGCRVVVQASVQVPAGELSLADVLAPESCPQVRRAARNVRLGQTPLAGSVRVLRADEIEELLKRAELMAGAGDEDCAPLPERVVVRRSVEERQPERFFARRRIVRPHSPLIRRGQKVTLVWEQDGIRVTVPGVSLDSGEAGETLRVRLAHGGRVLPALVVAAGELRIGS